MDKLLVPSTRVADQIRAYMIDASPAFGNLFVPLQEALVLIAYNIQDVIGTLQDSPISVSVFIETAQKIAQAIVNTEQFRMAKRAFPADADNLSTRLISHVELLAEEKGIVKRVLAGMELTGFTEEFVLGDTAMVGCYGINRTNMGLYATGQLTVLTLLQNQPMVLMLPWALFQLK
jgi:hypothetical protein